MTTTLDLPTLAPPIIDERVRRGADFLDEQHPGWEAGIDLDEFALDVTDSCVLGQLYGDYGKALGEFGWNKEDARFYGFCATDRDWQYLETDWRALIAGRRAG